MMRKIKHIALVIMLAWLFMVPAIGLAYPAPPTDHAVWAVVAQQDADITTPYITVIYVSAPTPVQPAVSTDSESTATGESAILVTPDADQIPGLITEVMELIKNKQWPAAIALMIVILMGILKMDIVNNLLTEYIPKRILPIIPLVLGAIAGAITGYITGGWPAAAQIVVESGVLAIVFHQVWSHTVIRKGIDDG